MVASLVLRLAAGAASVMAAISAISLEVTVPGLGSCDPLRGQVHNAPGNPGDYKVGQRTTSALLIVEATVQAMTP
jgi:hypothetical protein